MGGGKSAKESEDRRKRGCPPEARAAPWLMIPYQGKGKGYKHHQAFYNICEPNNKTCRKFIPELSGTNFYQRPSHQGWLIIICDFEDYDYTPRWKYGDCFLWNPVTTEKIKLPTLLDWYANDYELIDCVLSLPPRTTEKKTDSVVFFVFRPEEEQDDYGYEHVCFVYCRPGDKQWRIHKLSRDNGIELWELESVFSFKGKLYVMCMNTDHQEIDVNDDLTISVKQFHVKKDVFLFPMVGGLTTNQSTYYVEFPEELFRIDIFHHSRADSKHECVTIEVMRLNFCLMEWEKVNSLGQHVLFVGSYNTTACCQAADLGLASGCLYYLLPKDQSLYKFQIESTGNTVMLPCLDLKQPWYTPEWIMMPDNKPGREKIMLDKEGENCTLTALKIETGNISVNDIDVNPGDTEVGCHWNGVTKDIVELIAANYLHGLDYKNFRSVCKANREILSTINPTSYSLSPWMLFSRDHNNTIYNVVNPMYNNENYIMNLPDLTGSTIRFQKGGWLLMTRNENIFFYNPFTRETVKLPDMNTGYCYSVVSCFSLPTSSDCIVYMMDHKNNIVCIDFIRKGEAQWSSCVFDNVDTERYMPLLNTAIFHDGTFYCVDYNGSFGMFSVKEKSWKVLEKPHAQFDTHYPGFLVECGGELLLVKLGYVGLGGWVRIFRLNFSEMEWVKVKSLGDHMLFISHTSCFSLVAPNSNMKNKIYFPRLYLNDGGNVFYSLETHRYHSLWSEHSAKDLYDTEGWFTDCTWIEPNRLRSTSEKLDWFMTPSLN